MSDIIITNTGDITTANTQSEQLKRIVSMVSDAVQSAETKRKYSAALAEFMLWYQEQSGESLSRALVQRYLAQLRAQNKSAASIKIKQAAINKLISEAAEGGLLEAHIAASIKSIKGVRAEGVRTGQWLTKEQVQAMLRVSDNTLIGLRDRALLAVAFGTGMRRSEIASLTWAQLQQRDGRWLFADVVGKRSKARTVPVPLFTYQALTEYQRACDIGSGAIFRRIRRGAHIGESLAAQSVYDVVVNYFTLAKAEYPELFAGVNSLAAHDTRRTWAQLARKGGAQLEQISISLGHSSIAITERYLGSKLDLSNAACDVLGLCLRY